jgi:hypothetical protein
MGTDMGPGAGTGTGTGRESGRAAGRYVDPGTGADTGAGAGTGTGAGPDPGAGTGRDRTGGPRVLVLAIMDAWMFRNLVPPLRRLSAHVYAYPVGNFMGNWNLPHWMRLRRRLMDRFRADLRALASRRGVDLVLTLQYDDTVRADDVRLMRDLCGSVVHYHVDMNRQWYRVLRQSRLLSLLAVSHMQYLEPFVRRGVPLHYMPMAGAGEPPGGAAPAPPVPRHGVLMLGRRDPNRELAVAACREVTEEVDVYGSYWSAEPGPHGPRRFAVPSNRMSKALFDLGYVLPRVLAEGPLFPVGRRPPPVPEAVRRMAARARLHGYARDQDVPALMANAAITLGVNQRQGLIGDRRGFADSRLRDFEATQAGAFYMVQWYLDLPLFFRPGAEVETWTSLDELKEKVRYYMDHPERSRAIAEAGRRRALADHTWDARFRTLFARLGIPWRTQGGLAPLDVLVNLSTDPWPAAAPGCMPAGGPEAVPEPELAHLARPSRPIAEAPAA